MKLLPSVLSLWLDIAEETRPAGLKKNEIFIGQTQRVLTIILDFQTTELIGLSNPTIKALLKKTNIEIATAIIKSDPSLPEKNEILIERVRDNLSVRINNILQETRFAKKN
jgi:hypothetical protein